MAVVARGKRRRHIAYEWDWLEDYERGGLHSPYDPWEDIESDYFTSIEKSPTAKSVATAAEKHRAEIVRLENSHRQLIHKDARRSLDKELRHKGLKELGLSSAECESRNFVYYASMLELNAVARVMAIRTAKLEEQYAEYRGHFSEGPSEIELSTSNYKGEWSGVIQRGEDGTRNPRLMKPGYEDIEPLRRSVNRSVEGTIADASYSELGAAVKLAHESGYGASYLLTRRFDIQTERSVFSDVLIVPSTREIERVDLGAKAIDEGWL